ncbi:MAG: hypothetical protein WCL22_07050, partial [bacterium]
LNLATRGFLVYDYEDKVARIKKKLYDYVKARDAKADYDVIFFNSFVTNAANGVLNLETFDLKIQGVPMVVLSDSQQVQVYPKTSEVVLKKDMDFVFTGKMIAGLFDFYARDCSFEYNKFKINMPFVDSMMFYVKSKTFDPKSGTFPLVKVKTAITNLSGDLLIDDPGNKSGLKAIPEYPIFTNRNNAFVYWNKGYIQKGVYKKDKFFIETEKQLDATTLKAELLKDLEHQEGFLDTVTKKLSNERFVQNAKPEIVALEQKKQADALARINTIKESLANLA